MSAPFQTGDIVTVSWDHRRIRVLQTDAIETFYDAEMDEVGWVFARARTAIWYRISTQYLTETALSVVPTPFTAKDNRKFRPDLPMRIFQHFDADWSNDLLLLTDLGGDLTIPAQEIVIIPFGSKGGAAEPIRVQAGDGKRLSLRQIIEAAHYGQRSNCTDVDGVGLYRSGIVGGVPSYYLWGGIDRAGHAA